MSSSEDCSKPNAPSDGSDQCDNVEGVCLTLQVYIMYLITAVLMKKIMLNWQHCKCSV